VSFGFLCQARVSTSTDLTTQVIVTGLGEACEIDQGKPCAGCILFCVLEAGVGTKNLERCSEAVLLLLATAVVLLADMAPQGFVNSY
jgi:hypothetical protein